MKILKHPLIKYPLILVGIIIITSILFVLSHYLKDTFFLGPEPDLAGKSILFEAEGEGVHLFWRHYSENNEYTEEYLFDKPIEGDLSDVLLQDNGELWFIVSEDINRGFADMYLYKHDKKVIEEVAFFEKGGRHDLIRVSSTSTEFAVVERERGGVLEEEVLNDLAMVFEQNYLNLIKNTNITTLGDRPSCFLVGVSLSPLPCIFGYLDTDRLIRVDGQFERELDRHVNKGWLNDNHKVTDYTVLYTSRELASFMEVKRFGKRFTSGVVVRSSFMFSKDEQYAFLFTHNADNWGDIHTYLTHIDSGNIMKISEGNVPVLMP